MRKLFFILILLSVTAIFPNGSGTYAQDLHISEVMASNVTTNYDDIYYNFGDWIEIYNSSGYSIDLQGYYLTDDPEDLLKYQISYYYNINPGTYRIIWADSYDIYKHTNFSIDSDGEFIALVDPGGNIVDSVTLGPQFPDISYGRVNNNEPTWQYFNDPTPGTSNTSGIPLPDFSDDVTFSQEAGFYPGTVFVELNTANPVDAIRYTLDGSFPDQSSDLYAGPIYLSSSTTVRARSYTSQNLASPISSNSYFINEDSLTLPAISISTSDAYLNDNTIGMYVIGTNGITGNCIDTTVNFNQDWERPVNLEYFLPSGEQVISQVVGVKINGGCSRNVPSKSFAVYAREKYGKSRMEYPFFPNKDIPEYKNLVLRNSGNDYYFCYMRDGFMQSLIADETDIDYQSYQPVRMYINGNYWGILNMREKLNEHYLAYNHGVDPDSVDMIESNYIVIEGSDEDYVDMMNFLRTHDMTLPENYEYLCSQMDMNQFIDYYIAQIYYENEDWPFHNIKCWRPQTDAGKWRWLLFDTDYGFGRWPKSGNTVHYAFMDNWEPNEIAATLQYNDEFLDEFTQRFAARLNTTFASERVLHIMDSLVNNLDTEMHLHIARWGSPWAHYHWKDKIEVMEEFALGRGALMYQQIDAQFSMEGTIALTLGSANQMTGKVTLHDIPLDSAITATLFRNVPIRLQAAPKSGFRFSHWSGASSSTNPEITLTLSQDDTLTAHFTFASPVRNIFFNELSSLSENGIPDEMGESEDWIELYNGNSEAIFLDNLYLTDSLGDPFKHRITDIRSSLIIQPGGYVVLYADGEPSEGINHLNFKLSNRGETLALVQKTIRSYRIIDSISFKGQFKGTSYGRSPSDPDRLQYLIPTPGAINAEKRIENIVINEFMAANRSGITDNKGEYEDWIELYNTGDDPVSVSGIFITDSLPNKLRYHIPANRDDSLTIEPGEYLVLWADNQPEQGVRHLGFKLSGQGESIGLVQGDGIDYIDTLSFGNVRQDVAAGSLPDGSPHRQYLTPSPGESNRVELFDKVYINEVVASNSNTGIDEYEEADDWIELYNANDYAVDVGGIYITDSIADPAKCRIPSYAPDTTTIPPGGFIRLWADNTPEQGVLHLNFKLSSDGENIGIVRHDGTAFIDSLDFPELVQDAAYGSIPDGSQQQQLVTPTPAESNRVDSLRNLYINEYMASNTYSVTDDSGEYDDWIEVYNANAFEVNIGGLYFTDSLDNPVKHKISRDSAELTTIPALGHLVLWADNQEKQGVLHLGFKLSNDGEQIGLYLEDGRTPVDSLSYETGSSDAPVGRYPDGSSDFEYMPATPGAANSRNLLENILISEFAASSNNSYHDEYGEYNDWIEVYNPNNYPVNIGGAFITDRINIPDKFRIPSYHPDSTTIPARERIILWADNQADQGILHLDFGLSGKGEELALINTDGQDILDSLTFPDQYAGFSYGRKSDTLNNWLQMRPTPGSTNITEIIRGIIINEIMADNDNKLADEYGNFSDWIELYNSNDFPVDIGGYCLTDTIGYSAKYRIPGNAPEKTLLAAHSYQIVFADDSTELGPLHTNFKLSRKGEEIGLYHFDAFEHIDALSYPEQYENFAFARPEGGNEWISMPPTPLAPNMLPDFSELYINELMADNDDWISDENGEFDDWIELYNNSQEPIDIGGLFFSDSIADKMKHRIPSLYADSTTISPGGFMLLWADNDEEQGILHLGFKLSKDGEEIALFNFDGSIIDETSYTSTLGLSYGRRTNGYTDWTWFDHPTPAASNTITSLPKVNPEDFSLLLYPNPMTDYIRFVYTSSDEETVSFSIYNISGEKVYAQEIHSPTNPVELEWNGQSGNGKNASPGLYLFRFVAGDQVVTGRFVKR